MMNLKKREGKDLEDDSNRSVSVHKGFIFTLILYAKICKKWPEDAMSNAKII